MAKNDFKALLDSQIKKASSVGASTPAGKLAAEPESENEEPPLELAQSEPEKMPPAAEERSEKKKPVVPVERNTTKAAPRNGGEGRNINRVTVNLFEADSRALGVIREKLGGEGHDFSSRSDSIKIGLRLAAKARPEELAKLFEQVKSEDRRFRSGSD